MPVLFTFVCFDHVMFVLFMLITFNHVMPLHKKFQTVQSFLCCYRDHHPYLHMNLLIAFNTVMALHECISDNLKCANTYIYIITYTNVIVNFMTLQVIM